MMPEHLYDCWNEEDNLRVYKPVMGTSMIAVNIKEMMRDHDEDVPGEQRL